MKKKLILVGGGGHCKSCIEVIESTDEYEIAGILDVPSKVGENISGYKIIGTDSDIPRYIEDGIKNYFVTLGQIQSASLKRKIFENIYLQGGISPTIISKHAIVSKRAKIGAGTIVMHGAIVNANVFVGENCIINTKANIEHEMHETNFISSNP